METRCFETGCLQPAKLILEERWTISRPCQRFDMFSVSCRRFAVDATPENSPVMEQPFRDVNPVDDDDQAAGLDDRGRPGDRGRLLRIRKVMHRLDGEDSPVREVGQRDSARGRQVSRHQIDTRAEAKEALVRELEHRRRIVDADEPCLRKSLEYGFRDETRADAEIKSPTALRFPGCATPTSRGTVADRRSPLERSHFEMREVVLAGKSMAYTQPASASCADVPTLGPRVYYLQRRW